MKLPLLFSSSLFVAPSVIASSSSAIKSILKDEIASASRRGMVTTLQSHHNGLYVENNDRLLQEDCAAASTALNEDAALAEASATWLANYEALFLTFDVSACDIGETSADCKFGADPNGTQEYKDACTAAGGTPKGVEVDIACSITLDGQTITFTLDYPTVWVCLPDGCESEVNSAVSEITGDMETQLESAFAQVGGSSSCDVGEDAVPTDGAMTSASIFSLTLCAVATTAAFFVM